MFRSTISTFQLFAMFPDEKSARVYLDGACGPPAPYCTGSWMRECALAPSGRAPHASAGFYRCFRGGFDFTVRTNTAWSEEFAHNWLYSMYLLVTALQGYTPCLQLSKEIGVTQKTAWFILGRLREACGGDGRLDADRPGKSPSSWKIGACNTPEILNDDGGAVLAMRPAPKSQGRDRRTRGVLQRLRADGGARSRSRRSGTRAAGDLLSLMPARNQTRIRGSILPARSPSIASLVAASTSELARLHASRIPYDGRGSKTPARRRCGCSCRMA